MSIFPLKFNSEVQALLSGEGLPYEDLSVLDNVVLFGLKQDNEVAGIVGVEFYNKVGLIRSLVVDGKYRNSGYGESLIAYTESWSLENGIESLYLLTTTAKDYFTKHGYEEMVRSQAPSSIASSAQFSGLCPSSAIFMHKKLSLTSSSTGQNTRYARIFPVS
jgi:amino-acid N-acetyltransferase